MMSARMSATTLSAPEHLGDPRFSGALTAPGWLLRSQYGYSFIRLVKDWTGI